MNVKGIQNSDAKQLKRMSKKVYLLFSRAAFLPILVKEFVKCSTSLMRSFLFVFSTNFLTSSTSSSNDLQGDFLILFTRSFKSMNEEEVLRYVIRRVYCYFKYLRRN